MPAEMSGKSDNDGSIKQTGPKNLNSFHIWAFGICMSVGGQYIGWNLGLSGGFGNFVIAAALTASAYSCLILCVAEISSALPFAGGSYGIARVTLGIFPGYLIACFDSLESILYTASALVLFAEELTSVFEIDKNWEVLYWAIAFGVTACLQLSGGHLLWGVTSTLAVISVGILVIYILSASQYADFDEYAAFENSRNETKWFHGGINEYMHIAPTASWLFVGVESINLACKDVADPKAMIPKGFFWCMLTLFLLAFPVIFVVSSTYPGLTHHIHDLDPLNSNFEHVFNISPKAATLLSLPATYAVVYGFSIAFSRQIRSMAASGILNPLLHNSTRSTGAPYAALFAGWVVVFFICLAVHLEPPLAHELFDISMLFAYTAYIAQLLGFIMFRRTLSNIKKQFANPLGEYAAYWAILVFSLNIVSILAFQGNQTALYVYLVFVFFVAAYYNRVVKDRQYFSKEEQQVLFIAHVQKNNAEKRRLKRSKSNQSSQNSQNEKGMVHTFKSLLPEALRSFVSKSAATNKHGAHPSVSRTNGARSTVKSKSSAGQSKFSVGSHNSFQSGVLGKRDKENAAALSTQEKQNHLAPRERGPSRGSLRSGKSAASLYSVGSNEEGAPLAAGAAGAAGTAGTAAATQESDQPRGILVAQPPVPLRGAHPAGKGQSKTKEALGTVSAAERVPTRSRSIAGTNTIRGFVERLFFSTSAPDKTSASSLALRNNRVTAAPTAPASKKISLPTASCENNNNKNTTSDDNCLINPAEVLPSKRAAVSFQEDLAALPAPTSPFPQDRLMHLEETADAGVFDEGGCSGRTGGVDVGPNADKKRDCSDVVEFRASSDSCSDMLQQNAVHVEERGNAFRGRERGRETAGRGNAAGVLSGTDEDSKRDIEDMEDMEAEEAGGQPFQALTEAFLLLRNAEQERVTRDAAVHDEERRRQGGSGECEYAGIAAHSMCSHKSSYDEKEDGQAEEGAVEGEELTAEDEALQELVTAPAMPTIDLSDEQLKAVLCGCNESFRNEEQQQFLDAMIRRSVSRSHCLSNSRSMDMRGDIECAGEQSTERDTRRGSISVVLSTRRFSSSTVHPLPASIQETLPLSEAAVRADVCSLGVPSLLSHSADWLDSGIGAEPTVAAMRDGAEETEQCREAAGEGEAVGCDATLETPAHCNSTRVPFPSSSITSYQ